jgi:hypothetical protein
MMTRPATGENAFFRLPPHTFRLTALTCTTKKY